MGGAMLPPRSPLGTTIASFLQPSYPKRASGFPALQEPWGPGMTPGTAATLATPIWVGRPQPSLQGRAQRHSWKTGGTIS